MTRAATVFLLIGLMAAPAAAQGRGRKNGKIPPGHMPAAGQCRVWYDGVPPGRQPAPMSCAQAERLAARDGARVIYGSERNGRVYDNGRRDDIYGDDNRRQRERDDIYRDDDRRQRDRDDIYRDDRDTRDRGRAVPRTGRLPQGSGYPSTTPNRRRPANGVQGGVPFQNGYGDGLNKGREDADDRDSYQPNRHSWYRSANRGYNSRYGSREQYSAAYRQGFKAGYDDAYRAVPRTR